MKYKNFIKENKKQQIYFQSEWKKMLPKFETIKNLKREKLQRDNALGNTFELVCDCCYYYEVVYVNYGDDSQKKDGRRNPCVHTNVCTCGYALCRIRNTKPGQRDQSLQWVKWKSLSQQVLVTQWQCNNNLGYDHSRRVHQYAMISPTKGVMWQN